MTLEELLRNDQLDEAVIGLTTQVRDNPLDSRLRTSLFELLCFIGDYSRAEKQLDVLAGAGPQSEIGAMLYRGILRAERTRQEMFESGSYPKTGASEKSPLIVGSVNGRRFTSLCDEDPRISSNLELFSGGSYLWIPFTMIESITMQPPKRLRDLLWRPAVVRTSAAFKGQEIGEAFVPVLCPGTHKESDSQVRLGHVTFWVEDAEGRAIPIGQKMLAIDEEKVPILEISELKFQLAQTAP